MKRVFDVIASAAALILGAPVMAAIACAVRVSSPGPILYRHTRIGKDYLEFDVLKFRTMRTGLVGANITSAGDPRITTVGRFLRQYKLDELPQLLNVLRGEMSIVGPRPEVEEYVSLMSEYRSILSVRPGLTDPASLRYRHEQELLEAQDDPQRFYIDELLPEKVRLSKEYVETQSLIGDLVLIAQTLKGIVR